MSQNEAGASMSDLIKNKHQTGNIQLLHGQIETSDINIFKKMQNTLSIMTSDRFISP